jgi:hypothetical protein
MRHYDSCPDGLSVFAPIKPFLEAVMKTPFSIMVFFSLVLCAFLAAPAQAVQKDSAALQKTVNTLLSIDQMSARRTTSAALLLEAKGVDMNLWKEHLMLVASAEGSAYSPVDLFAAQDAGWTWQEIEAVLNDMEKGLSFDKALANLDKQQLDQAEKDLESIVTAQESKPGTLDSQQAVDKTLNAVANKLLNGYPTANDLKNLVKSVTWPDGTPIPPTPPGPPTTPGPTPPGTPLPR